MYTCVHVCVRAHVCACGLVSECDTHAQTRPLTCTHAQTHTSTHTHAHTHTRTLTQHAHTRTLTHTGTHKHKHTYTHTRTLTCCAGTKSTISRVDITKLPHQHLSRIHQAPTLFLPKRRQQQIRTATLQHTAVVYQLLLHKRRACVAAPCTVCTRAIRHGMLPSVRVTLVASRKVLTSQHYTYSIEQIE